MNKGHILVVDDERDFVELIKSRLESYSYTVTGAYDGEEAITKAEEIKPDLVLLDIMLPKMDGLGVLKALMEHNPELYVVMLTAHASLNSAVEALRYGAHDYLIKPLEEGRLETVVKRCLEKVRLQRELKEAQDRLLSHSQKLAAIGQLAAGIVHEIANPLIGIRGTTQLLLRKGIKEPEVEGKIKIIEKETSRCQEILKRLLGFTRLPEAKVVLVNVNDIINDALLLLEPQASLKKVKFKKELDPNISSILAIPDQLKQVFLNLTLNAFQAMTDGGNFTIATSTESGNFILIKFIDTGCGIPEENMKHLFAPFFTTKKVEEGTGLGLAVSYGIIQKHNGSIEVESKVGEGTKVTVKLPIAEKE